MAEVGFEFGNRTDTGMVREKNEDYYGYFSTPLGELFVVCDGMGGHKGGQVASRMSVETIRDFFASASQEADPQQVMANAISAANTKVTEAAADPELEGMGTTVVALLVLKSRPGHALIAHVGDSRIYRIDGNGLEQITQDHSFVGEMLKKGLISQEEARDHPRKNVITRAIGAARDVKPEIRIIHLHEGDTFLLCSDGVTDMLTDADIAGVLGQSEPQMAADRLVEMANERGGYDNSTVQVVRVTDLPEGAEATPAFLQKGWDAGRKAGSFLAGRTRIAAMVGVSLGLLVIVIAAFSGGNGSPGADETDTPEVAAQNVQEQPRAEQDTVLPPPVPELSVADSAVTAGAVSYTAKCISTSAENSITIDGRPLELMEGAVIWPENEVLLDSLETAAANGIESIELTARVSVSGPQGGTTDTVVSIGREVPRVQLQADHMIEGNICVISGAVTPATSEVHVVHHDERSSLAIAEDGSFSAEEERDWGTSGSIEVTAGCRGFSDAAWNAEYSIPSRIELHQPIELNGVTYRVDLVSDTLCYNDVIARIEPGWRLPTEDEARAFFAEYSGENLPERVFLREADAFTCKLFSRSQGTSIGIARDLSRPNGVGVIISRQ